MNSREHWEKIYTIKSPEEVSWYQGEPSLSLELIQRGAPDRESVIWDIGGGASTLVDGLLSCGYRNVTVLDLSPSALECASARLEERSDLVRWVCGDVLSHPFPESSIDVWHDRAAFHFLTSAEDRALYKSRLVRAVRPGGTVVIATFASDGPPRCSGLEIARYGAGELSVEFAPHLELLESLRELHATPSGSVQAFQYCRLRLRPEK